MRTDVLQVIGQLELAALNLETAMIEADKLRTRGGLTFQERVALNVAAALGRRAALR